jgi:hypothetical protein
MEENKNNGNEVKNEIKDAGNQVKDAVKSLGKIAVNEVESFSKTAINEGGHRVAKGLKWMADKLNKLSQKTKSEDNKTKCCCNSSCRDNNSDNKNEDGK